MTTVSRPLQINKIHFVKVTQKIYCFTYLKKQISKKAKSYWSIWLRYHHWISLWFGANLLYVPIRKDPMQYSDELSHLHGFQLKALLKGVPLKVWR